MIYLENVTDVKMNREQNLRKNTVSEEPLSKPSQGALTAPFFVCIIREFK
jgi:hypothetical protein